MISPAFPPVTNQDLLNVLDMNPLTHYVEALVSIVNQLNWTRIGLISDDTHYNQYTAELLQKHLLDPVVPYIRLRKNPDFHQVLQTIQQYGTQVIVISMNKLAACSLLEVAEKMVLIGHVMHGLFLIMNLILIPLAVMKV